MPNDDFYAIPKDILFPDELNRYLRDQIAAFVHENATLRKDLAESEKQFSEIQNEAETLRRRLKDTENSSLLPSFVSRSETVQSKIVELSKNYREKCSELEKYKTRCSKLTHHLEELNRTPPPPKPPEVKPESEKLTELKQLNEKLTATTSKMLELKNSNTQLKNELRQAQKLLQQETGEDLNSLQASGSWKGRAQVICDLQERNKKLREKLKAFQELESIVEARTSTEKLSSRLTELETENGQLKSQNDSFKGKNQTLKSRCSMLEVAHHELKQKVKSLKAQNAEQLETIATMSKQLLEVDQSKKMSAKQKEVEVAALTSEIRDLKLHLANYKEVISSLKAQAKEGSAQANDGQGDKNSSAEEDKAKLLELLALNREHLEKERNEREKIQQLYRLEKQRTVKLEAAVAKAELGSGLTSRSSYTSISQASRALESSLKNQLEIAEESVKTLQLRLQLEQNERKRDFQEFSRILSRT